MKWKKLEENFGSKLQDGVFTIVSCSNLFAIKRNVAIAEALQKIDFPVDYMEYDDEEGGIFTTKSDYLRILQLAKLRNISFEKQYDLK